MNMEKKQYIIPSMEVTRVAMCEVMKIGGEGSGGGKPGGPGAAPRRSEDKVF